MGDDQNKGIDWNKYGGGGAVGGGDTEGSTGTPSYPKDRVVRSLGHLQALIPDYESRSLADLLKSPLFTGKTAYTIDPKFYSQLQGLLQVIETKSGVSVSDFANRVPASVLGSQSQLSDLLEGLGIGGFGSGSTHVAQPYGFVPPDPQSAALIMLKAWESANALIDQGATHQEAMAEFEAKWKQLEADTNYRQASLDVNVQDTNAAQNRAENEDRRLREAQQAANRIAVAEQATTRGRSVLQDYLPNAIQGGTALNFGGLRMPLIQASPTQIFNQGGPGDLSQIPNINPNPATPYQQFTSPQLNPIGQMPNFPQMPQYQPPPDIQALIQQITSGSGPMGWA